MRCFIFGALAVNYMPIKPTENDYIIAADKGYEHIKNLDFSPNLIVGDFDSLGYVPQGEDVKRLNVRKDDTDTAHAAMLAFDMGYRDFVFYGCTGGKLDHSIANIQLAKAIAEKGGKAKFIGNNETFTVIKDNSVAFDKDCYGRISVFSLSDTSKGVSEEGLLYSLNDATLYNDNPLGVSNEFIGKPSSVSVKDGCLLIITENK